MSIDLKLIPLRNLAVFPGVVQQIDVGRPRSNAIAEHLMKNKGERVAVATQRHPDIENPSIEDLYPIAVECDVLNVTKVSKTRYSLIVKGLSRLKLTSLREDGDWISVSVDQLHDQGAEQVEAKGLAMAVKDASKQLIAISIDIPDDAATLIDSIREPGVLADVATVNLESSLEVKMKILGILDVEERLREVLSRLQRALEVYRVKEHIDSHVRAEMGKHQREAVLRQRLRAIQDELGDSSEDDSIAELQARLEEAKLPKEAREAASKQINRLAQIPQQSPEHVVTRTYVEWLVDLPWTKTTPDNLDLDNARSILDADHFGLEKVKKRIVEYLAVRKLKPDKKGPILCLVGPPGVGKTSTGKSVARALGREFIRASLGGVRDEAEIRGHRRTYVGALPGRMIQGIKKAGTCNPVFVLDEIDKLGSDFRGDPSSAMLEVLDPAQNDTFSDHFLEVPFDLSQVLFFATANDIDQVPHALRDRLEVLEVPGYTRKEKAQIARRHLLPKQIEEHGLLAENFDMTDAALELVINSYTREAGVRKLEREIASVCRGVAVRVAEGHDYPKQVDDALVKKILGPIKYIRETGERTDIPGVCTGLAWTPVGGEILFVEAAIMPGQGKLKLTGQLGSVMQESAQAASSYARLHAERFGYDQSFFEKTDIHIHVPSGAIKKDGPSAGVTMITALISLLTSRRVRPDLAMTGEISLRGNVMPVGGIKEKVIAAHRHGVERIILPKANEKDIVDIPKEVQSSIELNFVENIAEVIDLALVPKGTKTAVSSSPAPVSLQV